MLHCVKSVRIRSYSDLYFPAFWLNTEIYGVYTRIQSEYREILTKITLNTDIFYRVLCTTCALYSWGDRDLLVTAYTRYVNFAWKFKENLLFKGIIITIIILSDHGQIQRIKNHAESTYRLIETMRKSTTLKYN